MTESTALQGDEYEAVRAQDVPEAVRFDIPRRNQGQMLEVAYGGYGQGPWDEGDPYRRVVNRTEPSTTYYRRAPVVPSPANLRVAAEVAS